MARIDYIPTSQLDQLNSNEPVLLNLDELTRELKTDDPLILVEIATEISLAYSLNGHDVLVCKDSCDPRKGREL